MELYEAIARRRTVREFRSDPVPETSIRRVLAAGLRAPCNAHLKSWQFVLLRDRDRRRRAVAEGLGARDMKDPAEIERFLQRFTDETLKAVYRRSLPRQLSMMLEAPEVLVVFYRMKPLADCRSLFELNPLASAWMCIENIVLALAAEGLYGCTYTPYDAAGLKEALGVPPGWEAAAIIPFGYAQTPPEPNEAEDVASRLHVEAWVEPGVSV
ncbi:MAG TPA: nitroreductase family protein [Acidobacteriota bacterium]|nr:nitroreductase family protein [Acidobacteriota bacterium]HQM63637.1 nitroreductase family protein [Acidobacteriota bacterium]